MASTMWRESLCMEAWHFWFLILPWISSVGRLRWSLCRALTLRIFRLWEEQREVKERAQTLEYAQSLGYFDQSPERQPPLDESPEREAERLLQEEAEDKRQDAEYGAWLLSEMGDSD